MLVRRRRAAGRFHPWLVDRDGGPGSMYWKAFGSGPGVPLGAAAGRDGRSSGGMMRPASVVREYDLFLFSSFRFAPFALRLQPFLATLGAFGSAFHQLGTDQFDHRLLRPIAL